MTTEFASDSYQDAFVSIPNPSFWPMNLRTRPIDSAGAGQIYSGCLGKEDHQGSLRGRLCLGAIRWFSSGGRWLFFLNTREPLSQSHLRGKPQRNAARFGVWHTHTHTHVRGVVRPSCLLKGIPTRALSCELRAKPWWIRGQSQAVEIAMDIRSRGALQGLDCDSPNETHPPQKRP